VGGSREQAEVPAAAPRAPVAALVDPGMMRSPALPRRRLGERLGPTAPARRDPGMVDDSSSGARRARAAPLEGQGGLDDGPVQARGHEAVRDRLRATLGTGSGRGPRRSSSSATWRSILSGATGRGPQDVSRARVVMEHDVVDGPAGEHVHPEVDDGARSGETAARPRHGTHGGEQHSTAAVHSRPPTTPPSTHPTETRPRAPLQPWPARSGPRSPAPPCGRAIPVAAREHPPEPLRHPLRGRTPGLMVGELGRVPPHERRRDLGAQLARHPLLAVACVFRAHRVGRGQGGHRPGDGRGVTPDGSHDGLDRHLHARVPNASRGHGAGDYGTMVQHGDGCPPGPASRVTGRPPPAEVVDSGVGPAEPYALSPTRDAAWPGRRVRHHPRQRRRRAELAPAALPVESTPSASTSPTAGAAGLSAPTASSSDGGETWRTQPGAPPDARLRRLPCAATPASPSATRARSARATGATWQVGADADPARGALAALRLAR
jgi:hypothetical protein